MAHMPITSSAKKAHRASLRKRVFNIRRSDEMVAVVKNLKKLVLAGKKAEAEALIPKVYQAIDKAAKRGVINKGAAARKKSRLVALVRKGK